MKRSLPLLALLSLVPTVTWAEPLPFAEQPVNFYWRGELYGMPKGWQNKDLPLTEEQGREFLRTLHAGLNPVMFWRTQPEAVTQPGADANSYYYREIDYDLEASKGSGAKMLFQIHVDRPPNWYAPKFPGRVSEVHPAYDVRPERVQVEQGGWPEHIFNPDNKEMMADAEKMIRASINRYKDNPQVKGFLIGAGIGQVEMVLSHDGLAYGHSPDEQKAFQAWLSDRYSLEELSKRWWGRRDHYTSWEEVRVPAPYEFFGWGPLQGIALTGNLRDGEKGEFWVRSGEQAEALLLDTAWGQEGSAVVALPAPLPKKDFPEKQTVLRRPFEVSSHDLEAFRKQGVWLYGEGAMRVVVNGHDLGTLDGRSTDPAPGVEGEVERAFPFNPFAVRVEDKLKEGTNVISILPEKGLSAPLFLSMQPPVRYPYLGKELNARYVDWIRWAYDRAATVHDYFYGLARVLAPDAQLVVFSPHGGLLDAAGEIAIKYNVAIRFTGGEAYYYPWYSRAGLITGYPGSVEPSAPILTEESLNKSLGWWFFNNDQDLAFFWDLSNYASPKSPVHEPMLKAAPLLSLFGKYAPKPPTLAFLRTSLQFQLEEYFMHPLPFLWDPGRGEVQKSGIEFGYVTETPLSRGLPDNIRVMMDTGTSVMEETVLQDLEQWVREGGTFIALHHTGRHTLLEANAWPISRISGFQVIGFAKPDEKIRFEAGQKLWTSLSGERSGTGSAVDFTGQNTASGGIRMQAAAEDCEVIARWADGSVAVGRRPLGEGQVIVLGSTFWRNGRDSAGIYSSNSGEQPWLAEMLGNLGVPVPVPARFTPSSPGRHDHHPQRQTEHLTLIHSLAIRSRPGRYTGRNSHQIRPPHREATFANHTAVGRPHRP